MASPLPFMGSIVWSVALMQPLQIKVPQLMIGYCWSFNMSLEVEIKQTAMKVACRYLTGQRFNINYSRLIAVHLNLLDSGPLY